MNLAYGNLITMNQTCTNCGTTFEIRKEDQAFYDEMDVPPPTHCYLCRMQRRLGFRNERFLYHRKCDLTGKQMISSFSIDKPFPVYDNDEWWSDKWDPLKYGRDFDFSRPFFEQFFDLRDEVPHLARQQQKPMENSDYCNCASHNKNCYLVFSTNGCEDCYYGSWVNQSKDCVDNLNIEHCELCYECVGCHKCYDLRYSQDCTNCKESFFLRNCMGCLNCFGCSNQINKQYMVFNEQKTQKEYEEFLAAVHLGKWSEMEPARKKVDALLNDLIVKEFHGSNLENSSGDYMSDCKNCHVCFECNYCEDMAYAQCVQNAKTCMDYSHWGQGCERMYECQACGYDNFNLRFCNLCWSGCSNLTYCHHTFASKDSFGCVGLKQNQYCIFNKQYSQEEYEDLSAKITEHMKQSGEWGEFFPLHRSMYAYNETLSHEQIPMSKEEVAAKGWLWHEEDEQQKENYMGPTVEAPDDIADVDDDICNQILTCSISGKPYKIIPQELKFYRQLNIPLPRACPDERHYARLKLRNPRVLFERTCEKCSKDVQTTYESSRPEQVYCEDCYLSTVR